MGGLQPSADPCRNFGALISKMQHYNHCSLAEKTKNSYETGIKQFYKFCNKYQIERLGPILPASENILRLFATELASTVSYATIKLYLAAVKHLHFQHNYDLPLNQFNHLQYLLRGIKRYQGTITRERKPITPAHLQLFYNLLHPAESHNVDTKMLWAATCLAFFGFMRVSEFTCNSPTDAEGSLNKCDVSFFPSLTSPAFMKVVLKSSKTDPFRKGITITIGRTNNIICPVVALQQYMCLAKNKIGPLFQYQNGRFLTRTDFTAEVRNLLEKGGIKPDDYAGHSFRIGAATTAAAKKIPVWLIKSMGRWASDCYEVYVRTPEKTLIEASAKLLAP